MKGAYLAALLVTISCLALIDKRYKLAYFLDAKRTIKTLFVSVVFFCIWDIGGILLNIFFIGKNDFTIGLRIGQFPLEEIFFLIVLCYSALIAFTFIQQPPAAKKEKS